MATTFESTSPVTNTAPAAANRWAVATFGLTILVSAFLLFQVQPLVSKAILPWFGGCPAVWTTCMLFFQTLLFAGYVYAHLLQRWLAPRNQVFVHLALVAAALVMLPIAPGPSSKPEDISNPTWQILLLLTMKVGLPYFALSATSPLVQAWFSSANPGRSPYRLYALSNIGSLAALLSYPFVFEPALTLGRQSLLWSGAFVLYGALCAASLACLWQLRDRAWPAAANSGGEVSEPSVADPTWRDRLHWLALPACASLMLLAATNHICQDVAVVPFLWVLPLTLYLLSFIISFDHERWYVRPVWAAAAILGLGAVACDDGYSGIRYWILNQKFHAQVKQWLPSVTSFFNDHSDQPLSLPQEVILILAALFFVCMVCHGELARQKPNPRHLTEFYLLIAAGGALGGLFVAVVAPLIFSTYLEWPIGMVLSAVLAAGLLILPGRGGAVRQVRYIVFVPAACLGLWFLAHGVFALDKSLDRKRNFFGVVSVKEYDADKPERHHFALMNGRIEHGNQFADPEKQHWPTSYYAEESGIGQAIQYFQELGNVRIGVIGLGTGSVAVYAKPGDTVRFYEINPEVLRIASAGYPFTYLTGCYGKWEVVMGDARLSLDAEEPQNYQVLVLDAFSGDAIPNHLLTREAFDIYQRHLAPNGVIAVHISNRHLLLGPVVRKAAEHCKMRTTRISFSPGVEDDGLLLESNDWILVTANDSFLRKHPPKCKEFGDEDLDVPLWTDDYSNLFQILSGKIWTLNW